VKIRSTETERALRSILQERCGYYFEGVWLWRISGTARS